MTYTIWFDGGCKPNPGQGYGSWEIRDQDMVLVQNRSREQFWYMTNNLAEYHALQSALNWLINYGLDLNLNVDLEIRTDSRLVACQITGAWRVKKEHLQAVVESTRNLLEQFQSYRIEWNPRDVNVEILGH